MAENEMVGWHHRLNGHEFEHELVMTGVGDRQEGLAVRLDPGAMMDRPLLSSAGGGSP